MRRDVTGPMHLVVNQTAYQLRLLTRTPRAIFSAFLLPGLLLLAMSLTGTKSPAQKLVLAAGIAAFAIISTAYATHAIGLITARERGVLKRLRGTPLSPAAYFAGRVIATTMLATVAAGATIAIAQAVVGFAVPARAVPALIVDAVLASLCWASLGTAVTRLVAEPEAAWAMLSATYLPVVFVSGVFFPLSAEPSWLATVAHWLPVQPVAGSLTIALDSVDAFGAETVTAWTVLVAWGLIGALVALRTFAWERSGVRSAGGDQ